MKLKNEPNYVPAPVRNFQTFVELFAARPPALSPLSASRSRWCSYMSLASSPDLPLLLLPGNAADPSSLTSNGRKNAKVDHCWLADGDWRFRASRDHLGPLQ